MVLKSGDYPWCVCESKGNTVNFNCERCGGKHTFDNVGMPISRFLEISEAFCELHKDCKLESSMETEG